MIPQILLSFSNKEAAETPLTFRPVAGHGATNGCSHPGKLSTNGTLPSLSTTAGRALLVAEDEEPTMPKKATLRGRGPEFFGHGIDLLFGEEARATPGAEESIALSGTRETTDDTIWDDFLAAEVVSAVDPSELALPTEWSGVTSTRAVVDTADVQQEEPEQPNAYLQAAAAAFFQSQSSAPAARAGRSAGTTADLGGQDLALDLPPLPQPVESEAPQETLSDLDAGLPPMTAPEAQPGALAELDAGVPPLAELGGDGATEPGAASPVSLGIDDGLPPIPEEGPTAEAEIEISGDVSMDDGVPPLPAEGQLPAVGVSTPAEDVAPTPPSASLPETPQPFPIDEALPPTASLDLPVSEPAEPELPSASQPEQPTMPDQPTQPIAQPPSAPPSNGVGGGEETVAPAAPQPSSGAEIKQVGPPGVTVGGPVMGVSGGAQPSAEAGAGTILQRPKEKLSQAESTEILSRIKPADLEKLDREIDKLYNRVVELLSGEDEANVAFEALRKARQMLLLEPEQFAEIEYLVNQTRSLLIRVEQSATWGPYYGPRLLVYELIWLVFLGLGALFTTVPSTGLIAMLSAWFGMAATSAGINWVTLLMATVCWGGIGGVTGALWSLHYHVSIRRDFDKVENLWYFTQPILGMVLGGIVYLIIASGFLVVQVDLGAPDAALGARLLPAAIAVVVGFRQNLVLDLIDRIVQLLTPAKQPETPPPTQPTI